MVLRGTVLLRGKFYEYYFMEVVHSGAFSYYLGFHVENLNTEVGMLQT